jgi:hypothetical protein
MIECFTLRTGFSQILHTTYLQVSLLCISPYTPHLSSLQHFFTELTNEYFVVILSCQCSSHSRDLPRCQSIYIYCYLQHPTRSGRVDGYVYLFSQPYMYIITLLVKFVKHFFLFFYECGDWTPHLFYDYIIPLILSFVKRFYELFVVFTNNVSSFEKFGGLTAQ